jgi:uncharacterized protein (DUF1800 family)
MPMNRRDFLKLGSMSVLSLALASKLQWSGARVAKATQSLSSEQLHVLNRVTWGITRADIDRINALGIEGYVDWALDADNIPDPLVEQFVATDPLYWQPYEHIEAIARDDFGIVYTAALHHRYFCAAYSEKQLYEVMVEFWTDHFNIPIEDYLVDKIMDDREVIRRHALGKFRDLLFASAQSPAMLYYLDNAYSYKDHPNENYAREVMELHTLGVDGGYTEQDVRELARILTGWGVRDGFNNRFYFDSYNHDTEEKVFLGRAFPAGRGIEEGLEALDMLATHPSTANYVCTKLVRRFTGDVPPQTLVDSAARVWQESDGDIKRVLRHILLSPEFTAATGQKFKRPLHFQVNILRAFAPHFEIYDENWIIWNTEALGQMPWGWHPPNGYPDVTTAWISTGTLLERWNLGMGMPQAVEDWWEGGRLEMDALIPQVTTAGELVDHVARQVLGGEVTDADREMLINFVTDNVGDQPISYEQRLDRIQTLMGLVFNSPYFQWY